MTMRVVLPQGTYICIYIRSPLSDDGEGEKPWKQLGLVI